MSKYDITVDCSNVSVEYASTNVLVEATLKDVDIDDIISEIGETEVLDSFTHEIIAQYVRDNDIEVI